MSSFMSRFSKSPTKTERALGVLKWIGLAFLVFEVAAIVIFRMKWQPAMDAIRRFNKKYLNPQMMRFAGGEHWYSSVLHHKGRRTGREYATPVWVVRANGHFYIPLPYGEDVDWCRNVLEAGSCVVDHHGRRYEPTDPEIVSSEEAAAELPLRDRLRFSTYGVSSYLRLDVEGVRLARTG